MNDANQGADGRPRGSSDDDREAKADVPNTKRESLPTGFDPVAGDAQDEEACPDLAGMPSDEMGRLLRTALSLEVDTVASPGSSPIAADEPLSLDAAIASYGGLGPAPAELDDEAWCARMLAEPELRGDLVDLAHALEATGDRTTALPQNVRQAALGAFARQAALTAPEPTPTPEAPHAPAAPRLEPPTPRQPLLSWVGWRAAAAVLLVALGVTVVAVGGLVHDDVTGNGADAEAGLRLDHVTEHRLDEAGFVSREAWVRVGESFTPAADRVVVFGLGQASHVVVGDGDRLRVAAGKAIDARLMERARIDLDKAGGALDLAAVLRLEAGEAQLDTAGRRPVLLALGGELLLVLHRGRCHVAIDPGADAGAVGPAIALGADARAIVYRAANGDRAARTFELAGPKRVLLGAAGPKAFGEPAASLFRDLERFGGALETAAGAERAVRVQATLWRVLDGDATRADGRFRVLASGKPARLAFRPPSRLYGAAALRVWLRAPAKTRVTVRAAKAPDAELGAVALEAGTHTAEPGVASVRVPLPGDWFERLGGDDIVIEIAPGDVEGTQPATRHGFFEGAAFVMGDAAPRHEDPDSSR